MATVSHSGDSRPMTTRETSAATVRFMGGVGSAEDSSDSESEWEPPSRSGHKNSGSHAQEQTSTRTSLLRGGQGVRGDFAEDQSEIVDSHDSGFVCSPVDQEKSFEDTAAPGANEKNSPSPRDKSQSDNGSTQDPNVSQTNLNTRPRFNPFNRESFDEDEEMYPQLRETTTQGRPNDALSEEDAEESLPHWNFREKPVSNAELGLAEDHYAQPEGHFGMSTAEELELAINSCKNLISEAAHGSDRMKNLVNKLVQLRLKLAEAKDGAEVDDPEVKQVIGHRFMPRDSGSSKRYCEKCNSVIWSVLQKWYKCEVCGFACHEKCLNLITRTCASVKVVQQGSYIMSISPERGLAAQNYRCAECRTQVSYQKGFAEPRQCDYTGNFYCDHCHWNDLMIIPARVLHNWDLQPRKVCRASKQFLKLMMRKPVIRVQDINPMLFNFVEELNDVKKLREEILIMKKYFLSCRLALKTKLLLQLQDRQHFVENSDMYSLQDLVDVAMDVLLSKLAKIHASFAQHIKTDCQVCQAKGFMCELCNEQEVLFPFDNIAIVCSQCSSVLHRHCYMQRNQKCPKCARQSQRRAVEDQAASTSAAASSNPGLHITVHG